MEAKTKKKSEDGAHFKARNGTRNGLKHSVPETIPHSIPGVRMRPSSDSYPRQPPMVQTQAGGYEQAGIQSPLQGSYLHMPSLTLCWLSLELYFIC